MGANMIPMAKKRGMTVFGVNIGLRTDSKCPSTVAEYPKCMGSTHCHAFNRCCRNAVSRNADVLSEIIRFLMRPRQTADGAIAYSLVFCSSPSFALLWDRGHLVTPFGVPPFVTF